MDAKVQLPKRRFHRLSWELKLESYDQERWLIKAVNKSNFGNSLQLLGTTFPLHEGERLMVSFLSDPFANPGDSVLLEASIHTAEAQRFIRSGMLTLVHPYLAKPNYSVTNEYANIDLPGQNEN